MDLAPLTARPRAMAVAGALTIAFSSILVREAGVSPSTAAAFRCLYAVPILWPLARREDRRFGPRPRRDRVLAAIAGVFFAIDLVCWHHAIHDVGAGLSTVLANVQVAFVPLIAWLVLDERPSARLLATLPLMLFGIVLISGALEAGAYGEHPVQGVVFGVATGISYAGFMLVLRQGGQDLRRRAGPLSDATLVAAVCAIAIGAAVGDLDLVPTWPAHGWLLTLALSSQVVGWLLISSSLPRLPAALTSVLLTIQPIGSVVLGAIIFSESPSALQLVGVAAILAGLVFTARQPRGLRLSGRDDERRAHLDPRGDPRRGRRAGRRPRRRRDLAGGRGRAVGRRAVDGAAQLAAPHRRLRRLGARRGGRGPRVLRAPWSLAGRAAAAAGVLTRHGLTAALHLRARCVVKTGTRC